MNLVQAIVLPPKVKQLPAELVARTVAAVSVGAYRDRTAENEERWERWLGGLFTKSVRVAKSHADFAHLFAVADHAETRNNGEYRLTALAFTPQTYDEMDPRIRKARVEGLVCEVPLPATHPMDSPWQFDVVADMTDGKAAAQLAHAVFAAYLRTGEVIERFSVARPAVPRDDVPLLTITDSGLTEFEGVATDTVAVHRAAALNP